MKYRDLPKKEIKLKEVDELIDKMREYLNGLEKYRTSIQTKIIVSIVKDIYKKYSFKKEDSNNTYNKYVKYFTVLSKEDVDRFKNELNVRIEYPSEFYKECYDKDNNIAVRLTNDNITIFDYNIESNWQFNCE